MKKYVIIETNTTYRTQYKMEIDDDYSGDPYKYYKTIMDHPTVFRDNSHCLGESFIGAYIEKEK